MRGLRGLGVRVRFRVRCVTVLRITKIVIRRTVLRITSAVRLSSWGWFQATLLSVRPSVRPIRIHPKGFRNFKFGGNVIRRTGN